MKPHFITIIQYYLKKNSGQTRHTWFGKPGEIINYDLDNWSDMLMMEPIECVNHESTLDYLRGI